MAPVCQNTSKHYPRPRNHLAGSRSRPAIHPHPRARLGELLRYIYIYKKKNPEGRIAPLRAHSVMIQLGAALRFGKGQHYRCTLCTRLFLVLREPTRARRAQTYVHEVARTAQIGVTEKKNTAHRPARHRSAPDRVETKDEKPAERQEKNEDRGSGDDNDSDDDRRLVITIRVHVR
ncbi:hypothetical protein ALC56_14831 [Trachymyrmex septentrionalis]|uniref:Uncharacterized protein n=1 Tax=Trachymyrmex septentrionalis TaxID=34720 RepID=A0A195ET09_9HYME|nr:hypothetical protein ALC56_14831 [Trachymyrmex septentrionalis]